METKLLNTILISDGCSVLLKSNEDFVFHMIPELKKCKGFNQNNEWHIYDVYNHILKVIEGTDNDIKLRYAALFHDIGKPSTYSVDNNGVGHFYNHWIISKKIFFDFAVTHNLDSNLIDTINKLICYHDINFDKLLEDELEEICNKFSKEELILLFKLKRADLLAQNPKFHYLLETINKQEEKIMKLKEKEGEIYVTKR